MSLINYGSHAQATGTSTPSSRVRMRRRPPAGSGGTGTSPSISQGIIQFAGITAGRAVSFSGFYKGANGWGAGYLESADTVNMLAYTATFGGGFSATISLEDSSNHDPGVNGLDQNIFPVLNAAGAVVTPAALVGLGHNGITAAEGNYRVPDLVGVLRLDQSWGAVQLSGAVHQVATVALNGTVPFAANLPIGGTVPVTTGPATTPLRGDRSAVAGRRRVMASKAASSSTSRSSPLAINCGWKPPMLTALSTMPVSTRRTAATCRPTTISVSSAASPA